MEEVLSNAHVVFLVRLLTDDCVNNSLQDVLLWQYTFHVFDKLISLIDLVVLEIVDH